jgi:hypothetical protein
MKWIIQLVLILFSTITCFSQDPPGRWELGVNVLPLLDTSFYLLPPSTTNRQGRTASIANAILLRYQVSERFKLRTTAWVKINASEELSGTTHSLRNNVYGGHISVGGEYYIKTGDFSIYVGSALSSVYISSLSKTETRITEVSVPVFYDIIDLHRTTLLGIEGILGMNIRIVSNFYVSVETNLLFAHQRVRYDYERLDGEMLTRTEYEGYNRTALFADISPLSAVRVIYNF